MSDISRFTSRFRVEKTTRYGGSSRQPQQSKAPLACEFCRASKLKCDRAQPCGRCLRRQSGAPCSYRHLSDADLSSAGHGTSAEDRLDRLEKLITQMVETQSSQSRDSEQVPLTPPNLLKPNQESSGDLDIEAGDTLGYFGSTHWSAIIEDIHELKHVLKSKEVAKPSIPREPLPSDRVAELIFGLSSSYTIKGILNQYLPSRLETDRYLATYFAGEAVIYSCIHMPYFKRRYQDFWGDPEGADPLWLSILFSVFYMASMVQGPMAFGRSRPDFHIAAGKCLVLGEYHLPQAGGPEALALYAFGKSLKSLDPSRETATILGIAIRLAYEMGYHREPDTSGKISIFEAEMRRRFWSSCKQIDLMISFQLGLPSNIRFESSDVRSPRNLFDSDFDVDTKVLPPSRPETEATNMLWIIVKDRLVPSFGKVCQVALAIQESSQSETVELDTEIRHARTTIPEIYRARPIVNSIGVAPLLIMTRAYIDILSWKSLCILHRKHMVRGSVFSTRACIEAGMKIVSQVVDVYKEFFPGGIMENHRYLFGGFTMNDFLLGVVVLCSYAHLSRKISAADDAFEPETLCEVETLLQQSRHICIAESRACKDARRVSLAIQLTLEGGLYQKARQSIVAQHQGTAPRSDYTDNFPTPIGLQRQATLDLSLPQYDWDGGNLPFESLDPFNFMGNDFFDFDAALTVLDNAQDNNATLPQDSLNLP